MKAYNIKHSNHNVDLLTRILIEYEVINKIQLDLINNELDVFFLMRGQISKEEWTKKKKLFQQKFRVFNKLKDYNNPKLKITKKTNQQLTTIKTSNKLIELKSDQIQFLVNTVYDMFSNLYLEELNTNNYQLRSIDELLKYVRSKKGKKRNEYLAYKEGNRILVFNTTETKK